MAVREFGNQPLFSTTAPTASNPSTATLCAELILPAGNDTRVEGLYEVRFGVGASTGALWRLECAVSTAMSSGITSTVLRQTEAGTGQRLSVFTGSNLSGEFVVTWRAAGNDRFRSLVESTFTGTVAAWIQAERLT